MHINRWSVRLFQPVNIQYLIKLFGEKSNAESALRVCYFSFSPLDMHIIQCHKLLQYSLPKTPLMRSYTKELYFCKVWMLSLSIPELCWLCWILWSPLGQLHSQKWVFIALLCIILIVSRTQGFSTLGQNSQNSPASMMWVELHPY